MAAVGLAIDGFNLFNVVTRERERERERWGISREPLSESRGKIEREIRRSQKHGETVRERERETERERDRW